MSGEIETKKDDTDEATVTHRWLRELSLAGTHEDRWRKRAQKVIDRYRDEEAAEADEKRTPRFNILYANTEVLRGVIYQKTPVPDVRRRFIDKDPVGRIAAQTLQRGLSFCVDAYDFDGVMGDVVEDYLLPGRGVAKIKYVPTFAPMTGPDGAPMMDEAGQPVQQVVSEIVETDYVEWDMVRISPAKRWAKVRWIAFGELLTRDELKAQFGEIGEKCTLDWAPADKNEDKDDMFKRALVWTVWDKTARKVHVISKGSPDLRLAVKDDPLGLRDFWPCPEPVRSIKSTGKMTPIPEYCQYQDQAIELDNLTARIDVLVNALRRRGLYNGSYAEIAKLANAGDNEFIPVEKWSELMEGKGIDSAIWTEPIEAIAKVIMQLMEQREATKQIIYEVTGLADVVRGVSKATETLGAQQLKASYSNSRTGPRLKDIQKFARDIYRLKAEVIAEKFSPQTLAQMTGFDLAMNDQEKQALMTQAQALQTAGQPVPPELAKKLKQPTWEAVTGLLRDEKLRGFRVDIETDSTVQPDAAEEQKNRIELLTAITGFVEGIAPAVQSGAVPMDLAKEMLSFGVRAFKVSPQLEDALDALGGDQDQPQKQDPAKDQAQQAGAAIQAAEVQKAQAEAREADAKAREAEAKAMMAERQLQMPMMPPGAEPQAVPVAGGPM